MAKNGPLGNERRGKMHYGRSYSSRLADEIDNTRPSEWVDDTAKRVSDRRRRLRAQRES